MLAKRTLTFLTPLALAGGLFAFHPATGQGNPQCPTRSVGDSTNACASTAFVVTQISAQGGGGGNPSPAGLSGQIQFNNGGAFGGLSPVGGISVQNGTITNLSAIDIYLVIGASNSTGQGNAGQSPSPQGIVLAYAANGAIVVANDPVPSAVNATQNANTGSMWPSFGIAYGRPVGLVITGVSGSTQASACDFHVGNGNWQDTSAGSNYANALAAINAALPAFIAAGYSPTFRGIISNDLGGNDAVQINASACTPAQYTAAYNAMAANWRSATIGGKVYPHLPIYESIIGPNLSTTDSPGLVQVRNAQFAIAATDGNTLIPFTELPSFGVRNWIQAGSGHPTQTGYNEWGTRLGGSILPYIAGNISYQGLNANSAAPPLPIAGTVLQLTGPDSGVPAILMDGFGNNAAPTIYLRSAAGTNVTPTALGNGVNIGVFAVRGYGATGYSTKNNAAIIFSTTQPWTDTAQGNQACIFTTANGTTTPLCNFTVGQSGVVSAQVLSAQALSAISLSTQGLTVLPNGNVGIGTENNPQYPFIYSTNATTSASIPGTLPPTINGPMVIAATGTVFGYNGIGVANFTNNRLYRINGSVSFPTNLANADTIGGLVFGGWGNGALQGGTAQIVVTATEAWSGTTFGTSIAFNATPAGGARAQVLNLSAGAIFGTSVVADPGQGGIALNGRLVDYGYSYQTPTTGFSITLGNTTWHTIIDPAGTLATGTIIMPAIPFDGQNIDVRSSQVVTALTVNANAGQTIKGAPGSFAVGGTFSCIYRLSNTTWYC